MTEWTEKHQAVLDEIMRTMGLPSGAKVLDIDVRKLAAEIARNRVELDELRAQVAEMREGKR